MMTVDRSRLIGIKQIIRLEWLRKTVNLLLSGLEAIAIRQELHEFLQNDQLYNALGTKRSDQTRAFAVTNLMKIWVEPDPDLIPFRNSSLDYVRQNPDMDFAVHWGMLSAAYPFWFHIACHTGRLLALQKRITSLQITNRLKEQYGDKSTIIRNTGYVLRAFLSWGALAESSSKGCYENSSAKMIDDPHLAILLLESVLLAKGENKSSLNQLIHCPAFFHFRLPTLTSDFISRNSGRIEITRFMSGEEIFSLC